MTLNHQDALEQTIDIARGARDLLREGFARAQAGTLAVQFKGRFDPLTEYDQRCEAYVVAELRKRFPGHAIVGEEGGDYQQRIASPMRAEWHIDPIDGTHNFSHGVPWFCISIGLVENGVPALGVVFDPVNDRLYAARNGGGAILNGSPIRVSDTPDLEHSLVGTGFPTDRDPAHDNNLDRFLRAMQSCQDVRRFGAAALDLCLVASGQLDGYWQPHLKTYDVAAGVVIVREAGGRVTDFEGGADFLASGRLTASNNHVHDALLAAIQR